MWTHKTVLEIVWLPEHRPQYLQCIPTFAHTPTKCYCTKPAKIIYVFHICYLEPEDRDYIHVIFKFSHEENKTLHLIWFEVFSFDLLLNFKSVGLFIYVHALKIFTQNDIFIILQIVRTWISQKFSVRWWNEQIDQ